MATIDRRAVLRDFLPAAIVTAAGVTAVGVFSISLVPATPAGAASLTMDKINAFRSGERLEKAQVVVVGPPRRWRRRRRRVCWWRRGRRVCAWRWV